MNSQNNRTILGLTAKQWVKKIAGLIIGLTFVIGGTIYTGFPIIFTKLFSIYTVACFLFYVIIDLPPMKPLTGGRALIYLLITFLGFSIFYSQAAANLPQFDPKYEIAKINKPPLDIGSIAGPEMIAAGLEVFEQNKCFNCHQCGGKGSSNRGPHFDLVQIGLKTKDELMDDIIHPRKTQSKGFEDPKSRKAMPDYYGEDISKDEFKALLAFIQSIWSKELMPLRGKKDSDVPMVRWDEDPEMIALGKKVFEGQIYEDLNCAACHGKDGIPIMDGARDFRDPNALSKRNGKKLKDWTDADWFDSVANGVEDTPMMPWIEDYPPKAIWLAISYAKQFHKKNLKE